MANGLSRMLSALAAEFLPVQRVEASASAEMIEEKADGQGLKDWYPMPDALMYDDSMISARLEHSGAFRLYRQSSAVATAVNMIAEKIESLVPVITDRNGTKSGSSGEVLDLLYLPNGYQPYREFIGQLARYWLLTGNFYLFAGGSIRQLPQFIFAPHPQTVHVGSTSTTDNFPREFSVSSGDGNDGIGAIGLFERARPRGGLDQIVRFYEGPLRELFQARSFSSRARNLQGDSPLESVMLEIRQQVLGALHNASLLEKGARPSAVFAFKDRMTKEQYEQRVAEINSAFGGAKRAGRIAVLSQADLEVIMMGMTNVDMDFGNLNQRAREAVFTAYRIPSPLVTVERQTFSNYKEAILALYDDAVCPNADRIFEAISHFLLPRAGIDPRKYLITYDQTEISALRMRVLEELKIRKETGLETPNELRELIPDREPVEAGDVIYQPSTLVAMGTDPLEAMDPGAEEEDDPEAEAARLAGRSARPPARVNA